MIYDITVQKQKEQGVSEDDSGDDDDGKDKEKSVQHIQEQAYPVPVLYGFAYLLFLFCAHRFLMVAAGFSGTVTLEPVLARLSCIVEKRLSLTISLVFSV